MEFIDGLVHGTFKSWKKQDHVKAKLPTAFAHMEDNTGQIISAIVGKLK